MLAHLYQHGNVSTLIDNIYVENRNVMQIYNCKKRLRIMEALMIKKKEKTNLNISYEDSHNMLVVFGN